MHHTIARFRSKRLVEGIMEDLFTQFIEYLFEWDEVSFEHLFIDGTKVEANANRYSFVWIRGISKYQIRLYEKIEAFRPIYEKNYGKLDIPDTFEVLDLLKTIDKNLNKLGIEKGLVFVSGKGKRKQPLQRDI